VLSLSYFKTICPTPGIVLDDMVGTLDRCKAAPAKPEYIVELELHAIYDGNREIITLKEY
jgi:hypothetical protein